MVKIYFVGGDKGGVGKSLCTSALVSYMLGSEQKCLLVDTDTSNPDVQRQYKDEVECHLKRLSEKEGWIDIANICEENMGDGTSIIINSKAAIAEEIKKNASLINQIIAQPNIEFHLLWVINRQKDSLLLLKNFLDNIEITTSTVVKNLYWGSEEKFQLFDESKIKENINHIITLPDLADRVADEIYTSRISLTKAQKELNLGNRIEVSSFVTAANKELEKVVA